MVFLFVLVFKFYLFKSVFIFYLFKFEFRNLIIYKFLDLYFFLKKILYVFFYAIFFFIIVFYFIGDDGMFFLYVTIWFWFELINLGIILIGLFLFFFPIITIPPKLLYLSK